MQHGPTIDDNVTVIQRASVILDAFDHAEPRLCLTTLSDRTGLPKATVHRLLRQMVDAQLLSRVGADYVPGALISSLAELSPLARLRDRARPHLVELHRRTGQTVHLATLDRHQVAYLDKVFGPGQRVPTKVGGREPVHCTALGRVMLAFHDQDTVDRVVRRGLSPRTAHTVTDGAQFRRMIATAATERLAFDRSEHTAGLTCVAAPIGADRDVIGAVSISGPEGLFRSRQYTSVLLELSAQLSRACADVLDDVALASAGGGGVSTPLSPSPSTATAMVR